jgi:hypothetical protein
VGIEVADVFLAREEERERVGTVKEFEYMRC